MSEGRSSVLTVRCNGCGAPLEIRPGSRYVTCLHCDSQLEVHRTSNSISTEVLEHLKDPAESDRAIFKHAGALSSMRETFRVLEPGGHEPAVSVLEHQMRVHAAALVGVQDGVQHGHDRGRRR